MENFQKSHFGLEFPEFLNPKEIPQICRENWAILEKLRDSANSKPKFFFPKKQKPVPKKSYNFRGSTIGLMERSMRGIGGVGIGMGRGYSFVMGFLIKASFVTMNWLEKGGMVFLGEIFLESSSRMGGSMRVALLWGNRMGKARCIFLMERL